MTKQHITWMGVGVGGLTLFALVVWIVFFRTSSELLPEDTAIQQTFNQNDVGIGVPAETNEGTDAVLSSPVSQQKIFKISDGPVAGAAFSQEGRPTTTVARFVMQHNGHVLDLALDSPGSVSRAVSNTTIPGGAHVEWVMQNTSGRTAAAGALVQYLDQNTIKTVSLAFASTVEDGGVAPVRIQFLPNNIISLAVSPDGTSLTYLLASQSGSDGYISRSDGTNPRKVFSLPLSQITLSWPSPTTILATTKAATGVAGVAFSINTSSGTVAPILYALGLTTTADAGFAHVVYQSSSLESRVSYVHNTRTNLDRPLSFDPMPDKCIWSRLQQSTMYCAMPLMYLPPNYVELWHQGAASVADSIVAYNLITGQTTVVAAPGADGGVPSDILQMALSADEKYLLFVKKGDRSLWGVRL